MSGRANVQVVQLANCLIKDESGNDVQIGRLWAKSTALLIFLRHFACIACRAHAQQVWSQKEAYERGGAKISFIGNGDARLIKVFKEDLGIQDAPIYTDRSLKSFHAAGFNRGFIASMGPTSLKNIAQLKTQGHSFGKFEKGIGDLWQLGGILVIKPDGRVAYSYISQAQGDFPLEDEIKQAPWLSRTSHPKTGT